MSVRGHRPGALARLRRAVPGPGGRGAGRPRRTARGWPVRIEDPVGCDLFSARDGDRAGPGRADAAGMRRRLLLSGIRSISLAVDVTNYVMLETGQPMHAFDRDRLTGADHRAAGPAGGDAGDPRRRPARARPGRPAGHRRVRADRAGRDHGRRRAPRSAPETTDVVLEAAHWEPATISRGIRRHKLPSEASKRFERGVDPEVAGPALAAGRARCWPSYGGGRRRPRRCTVAGPGPVPVTDHAGRRPAGAHRRHPDPGRGRAAPAGAGRLRGRRGARRAVHGRARRPGGDDLVDPADLVEEVVRLEGYESIPSVLPTPPPGTRADRAAADPPVDRPGAGRGRAASRC